MPALRAFLNASDSRLADRMPCSDAKRLRAHRAPVPIERIRQDSGITPDTTLVAVSPVLCRFLATKHSCGPESRAGESVRVSRRDLLRRCAAMVQHGGAGTAHAAVAVGDAHSAVNGPGRGGDSTARHTSAADRGVRRFQGSSAISRASRQ